MGILFIGKFKKEARFEPRKSNVLSDKGLDLMILRQNRNECKVNRQKIRISCHQEEIDILYLPVIGCSAGSKNNCFQVVSN
jgi:hypothetical protein